MDMAIESRAYSSSICYASVSVIALVPQREPLYNAQLQVLYLSHAA